MNPSNRGNCDCEISRIYMQKLIYLKQCLKILNYTLNKLNESIIERKQ